MLFKINSVYFVFACYCLHSYSHFVKK